MFARDFGSKSMCAWNVYSQENCIVPPGRPINVCRTFSKSLSTCVYGLGQKLVIFLFNMSFAYSKLDEVTRIFRHLPFLGQVTIVSCSLLALPIVIPLLFGLICFMVGVRIWIRFTSGWNPSRARLDGRTVLLTGATSGIGYEMAKDLAARGARLLVTSHNVKNAQELADKLCAMTGNQAIIPYEVDLSNMRAVADFANRIMENEQRLDILINNAGQASFEKVIRTTDEGLEYQMALDYFGPFLLTNLLMDLLKRSVPSRIINATSIVHRRVLQFDLDNLNFEKGVPGLWYIYCTSKLCMLLFTRELARRLQGTGVTANCFHPGVVDTPLYDKQPPLFYYLLYLPRKIFFKTPEAGAQTALYLATAEEIDKINGEYFADCHVSSTSKLGGDMALAKALWEKSEEIVGLRTAEKRL